MNGDQERERVKLVEKKNVNGFKLKGWIYEGLKW